MSKKNKDASYVGIDSSRTSYAISFILAIVGILLFAIIVLTVYATNRPPSIKKVESEVRFERLQDLQDQDERELTTYDLLDKESGKVRIPIERAMELTARELGKKE